MTISITEIIKNRPFLQSSSQGRDTVLEPAPVDQDASTQPRVRDRLLLVGPSPPPYNGMSVITELLLRQLGKKLILIHLDTADRRGLSNVGRLDVWNVLLAIWHGFAFLGLLFFEHPDLVYVPISQATLPFLRDCLFLIPARILRKSVVVHLHGGYFHKFYSSASPSTRWLVRVALGKASGAIVLGQSLSSAFDGIIPREKVHVVPNGAPDLLDGGKDRHSDNKTFTVLFLSLLIREKGPFDLLRAIPIVVREATNCQFVFAGEWFRRNEMEEAENLVKMLGIEAYVDFAGKLSPSAKIKLLNMADAFVLPTYYSYEGQPSAILEAMSAGLPIITTRAGCIEETVIDDVNGFLVEAKNPEAIAEKILRLMNDSVLRGRMGAASRERFLSHYTLEEFIDRLARVLIESKHRIARADIRPGSVSP